MSFLSDLFGPSESTTTSKVELPKWVNSAAQNNYKAATQVASRPYQTYNMPRIAPFSADSTKAQSTLRGYNPTNVNSAAVGGNLPRMIDDIGQGGDVQAYMNPYVGNVMDRVQKNVRRSADMGQQNLNTQANAAGAFGDARHGVAMGEIERNAQDVVGDQAAALYSTAYDDAQRMRESDINRILTGSELDMNQLLRQVDALMKSGGYQEQKTQGSLDLAKQDFDNQQGYPQEMLNLLMSALNQTPYGKSSSTSQPGPSVAGQIAGGLGSLFGLFL